jgi:hypothetical protein
MIVGQKIKKGQMSLESFSKKVYENPVHVSGTAVFMSASSVVVPLSLGSPEIQSGSSRTSYFPQCYRGGLPARSYRLARGVHIAA